MSSSLSRINARTHRAPALVVLVTLLFAAGAPVAVAQEKKIPFDKLQQICHQFDQVMPQPPPVEPVLIGTLDASTGSFTWGGTVVSRETGEKIPIVDLSSIFANLKIPVFVPNLDPKITNLGGALGNTVDVGSLINNAINNSVGAHATGAGTPPAGATVHSGAAPAGAGGGIHAPPPRAKPGPAG